MGMLHGNMGILSKIVHLLQPHDQLTMLKKVVKDVRCKM